MGGIFLWLPLSRQSSNLSDIFRCSCSEGIVEGFRELAINYIDYALA